MALTIEELRKRYPDAGQNLSHEKEIKPSTKEEIEKMTLTEKEEDGEITNILTGKDEIRAWDSPNETFLQYVERIGYILRDILK